LSAQLLNYSFNRIIMAKSEIWCITFGHDNLISSFKFMFHSFFTQTNQPTTTTRFYIFLTFKVMLKKRHTWFLHIFTKNENKRVQPILKTKQYYLRSFVPHITKYFTTSQSIQTHFTFISTFSKTISKFQQTRLYVCAFVVIYCSQQNLCTKFGIKTCVAWNTFSGWHAGAHTSGWNTHFDIQLLTVQRV